MPISLWFLLAGVQGAASAQNKPELLARMHRVTSGSSLDLPGTKPWHLKATIQLNDVQGEPVEKGTVERWWASPDQYKTTYTFPSFNATDVKTPGGFYRTAGSGSAPYMVDYLLGQLSHPMPSDEEIDKSVLDLRKESFGKNEFDCVMLTQPIPRLAFAPFGLFPTYCLDHDKDVLRIVSESGAQVLVLNRKGVFRGTDVGLDMSVSSAGKALASAHVDELQGRDQAYPETQTTEGLEAARGGMVRISGGVIAANILKKVQPVYPDAAKDKHVDGKVILHAIIGTDGHVHALRPITYPDPDLVISAIAAVRQWTYKPYILNGFPTDVDTTITVNYALGN
jgi:hypothetical protein